MAIRISHLVVFLLGIACHFPETASAKPKSASFEKIIESSPTIVIAKSLGKWPDEKARTVEVEVVRVLKGDLKPGKHQFSFKDSPHVGPRGWEFIAFLDKDLIWRFRASSFKYAEKTVSKGLLEISGFYDWNAYFVSPNLITLEQLTAYLNHGSLAYRFRGDVYFPQAGKVDWKAGSLAISGTYDVVNEKVNVKGLPDLKSFPAQPDVSISSSFGIYEADFNICYARSLRRPLNFIGKVQGLDDKTGEIIVRFAVSAPEILTQRAFEDYLADASKGTPYYKFKLTCEPAKDSTVPKVLFLTMGKWTDNEWDSTQLEGFGESVLHVFGTSYNGPSRRSASVWLGGPTFDPHPKTLVDERSKEDWILRMSMKTEAGDYLTVGFKIGEPKRDLNAFSWSFQKELLYTLYRNNRIMGTIRLHDEKTARTVSTFTATFDSVEFNRIEGE